MSDNLQQLGPIGFQDLAAALACATFGSGVQVMGAGRDGGRDMYFRGSLVWKPTEEHGGEVWEGYTVFQVKHKAELSARPDDNLRWLWGQVREELDKWAESKSGRKPVPDSLIIVTNVALTPYPDSGGHDQLNKNIRGYIDSLKDDTRDIDEEAAANREKRLRRISKIKKWRFWDGNQIQALLKLHPGVRNAFPGFLTAADVFANLAEFTDNLPLSELEPGLRAHARTTLMGEGFIYFDEAGSGEGSGIPVHQVAIDLPITQASGKHRGSILHYVLDRADHVLKPKLTTQRPPRHIVVTGAPGNGKTTISKFLVQAFRASMLNGAADLSVDQLKVIEETDSALQRFGLKLPAHRRWAMRIDLAEYAEEGGLDEDSTLLRWVAHKVSMRSNVGNVKPWAMQAWMRQWPWFLVLDGLDEVTEPSVRKRLIQRVTEFVNDAEADDCDVFVVLTTRPIGYTENIAPTQFERIDLDYLEPAEAVRYGTLATKVRLRTDVDRIEKVLKQLRKAAEDEALRNLLRTPLQVLILTIIVDGAGQLAPDSFSLFWGYYETVFKRERDKPGGLHKMLQEYGQQIQQLHERVGFELQVRSESGDRSYATLTPEELRYVVWQVLSDAGFKPDGKDAGLLDKIFDTATRRLVLIAPRGHDGYGFDVRPLQELMAAMHLTSGPLDQVIERLRKAGASPYWRNTWLFAAGRLFSTPQSHQHEAITYLVETIDDNAEHRLGNVVPVGPRLALDIIDDGMARSLPRWRGRFIEHGLRVLQEPAPSDLARIVRILLRFADSGSEQRAAIAEGLRDALGGHEVARSTAAAAQGLIPSIADDLRAGIDARTLVGVRRPPNAFLPSASGDGWEDFAAEVITYPAVEDKLTVLTPAIDAIHHIKETRVASDEDVEAIEVALADQDLAKVLSAALAHVISHEPVLMGLLRDRVLPMLHRQAIGELLG